MSEITRTVNSLLRKESAYIKSLQSFHHALDTEDAGYGVDSVEGIIYPDYFTGREYCGVGTELAATYVLEQLDNSTVEICQGTTEIYNPNDLSGGRSVFHTWFDINRLVSVDMAAKQFNPTKSFISVFPSSHARTYGYYEFDRTLFDRSYIPGLRFLKVQLFQGQTKEADSAFLDLVKVFST